MFKQLHILFIGLCLLSFYSRSQTKKADSLLLVLKTSKEDTNKVKTLLALVKEELSSENYSKSKDHLSSALALSEKLHFLKGSRRSYAYLASLNRRMENRYEQLKNLHAVLTVSEQMKDSVLIGAAYESIGGFYWGIRMPDEALINFEKALDIFTALKNGEKIVQLYWNIGTMYLNKKVPEKSLETFRHGLSAANYFLKTTTDKNTLNSIKGNVALIYNNSAIVFTEQKNNSMALKYYDSSITVNKEIGSKWALGTNYENIAGIYFDQENYKEAEKYIRLSLELLEPMQNIFFTTEALEMAGFIALKQHKAEAAKKYFLNAAQLLREKGKDYAKKAELYQNILAVDSIDNNFKKAYMDFRQYIIFRDSAKSKEAVAQIAEEGLRFDFEKKNALEKAAQEKKDAIVAEEKQKQKIITWSVSLGLLLVVIFAGFIFNSLRITQKQKQVIEIQKAKTEEQKHLVEEKQKEILDSINYAKRLQDAILPPKDFVSRYVPQNFILYTPKDIVAGDFYWAEFQGGKFYIAAADSTGHGVPGAMVSVVCSGALNRVIKEFKIYDPGKILDKTRELVLETFEKSASEVKDGMDISLLCIDSINKKVFWSGANNPLWYIDANELKEIKADKQPIGKTENSKPFTTYEIDYKPGFTFYLFTDGLADQFGGPNGKKFKYKQFSDLLLKNCASNMMEQSRILSTAFEDWKGPLDQVDDVCVIGIRV